MTYLVIEVSTGDDAIAGRAIYEYPTLTEAIAVFHSKMGTAMKSEMYTSELLMVINSEGGIHKTEKFVRELARVIEE